MFGTLKEFCRLKKKSYGYALHNGIGNDLVAAGSAERMGRALRVRLDARWPRRPYRDYSVPKP